MKGSTRSCYLYTQDERWASNYMATNVFSIHGWWLKSSLIFIDFHFIEFICELLFLCIFSAYVNAMDHFNIYIYALHRQLSLFICHFCIKTCTSPFHIHLLINSTSWKLINLISFYIFFARMQPHQLPHCLCAHTWILNGILRVSLVLFCSFCTFFLSF